MARTSLIVSHEVEPCPDYVYKHFVYKSVKDKDGKHTHFDKEEVEETGGYMVFFPAGHSFHVRNEKELIRLELDTPTIVDASSGERAPADFMQSPKAIVQSKTRNRAR